MMNSGRNRRGAGVLVALIAIMLMSGTAAAFLLLSLNLDQKLQNKKARASALYAAESGVKIVWDAMITEAIAVSEGTGSWTYTDGQVIEGDLGWGRYSVSLQEDVTTLSWRLFSTGRIDSRTGQKDEVTGRVEVTRTIEVLLTPQQSPAEGPFAYALFTYNGISSTYSLFTDSYDSSLGDYATTHTGAGVFPTDWAGSAGGLQTNGTIILSSPDSEIHGPLRHGLEAGDEIGTFSGAAEVNNVATAPEAQDGPNEVVHEAVTQEIIDDATAFNSNTLINSEAIQDPGWFVPGVFEPYDEVASDLYVSGSDTVVKLGEPGVHRTYFFHTITVFDGVIEFQGPVTLVIDGFWFGDPTNPAPDMRSIDGVLPTDIRILGTGNAQAIDIQPDVSFGGAFYMPGTDLALDGPCEFTASMVVLSLQPVMNDQVKIHYDEAFGTVGGTPGGDVLGFALGGWLEH